jgi:hypothetical protein
VRGVSTPNSTRVVNNAISTPYEMFQSSISKRTVSRCGPGDLEYAFAAGSLRHLTFQQKDDFSPNHVPNDLFSRCAPNHQCIGIPGGILELSLAHRTAGSPRPQYNTAFCPTGWSSLFRNGCPAASQARAVDGQSTRCKSGRCQESLDPWGRKIDKDLARTGQEVERREDCEAAGAW